MIILNPFRFCVCRSVRRAILYIVTNTLKIFIIKYITRIHIYKCKSLWASGCVGRGTKSIAQHPGAITSHKTNTYIYFNTNTNVFILCTYTHWIFKHWQFKRSTLHLLTHSLPYTKHVMKWKLVISYFTFVCSKRKKKEEESYNFKTFTFSYHRPRLYHFFLRVIYNIQLRLLLLIIIYKKLTLIVYAVIIGLVQHTFLLPLSIPNNLHSVVCK